MRRPIAVALLALASGCALHPEGEDAERERAAEQGRAYEKPWETRELPPLPPNAPWKEILRRAFLANGELEARWWEWRAALERIPQEASPRTTAAFFFEHMIQGGDSTAWERTFLGAGNDPMFNIPWPGKLTTAGRRALEEARAAGLRFERSKFDLQRRVVESYQEWALLGERLRIGETRLALLTAVRAAAEGRTSAGRGAQYESLEAHTQEDLARNALESLRARVPVERARLNALAGRGADEPLDLPAGMPAPRTLAHSEAELIRLAAEKSPEVLALAREMEAGKEAIHLAELEFVPEFGLSGGADLGGIAQTIGGMITMPILRYEAIRGGIEEARARLEAASAMRRQASSDAAARMLLDLRGLSDTERQITLFQGSIIPRADMAQASARAGYTSGAVSLRDLLESSRMLLDAREMLAQLLAEREKLLADLEALAAVDVEVRV